MKRKLFIAVLVVGAMVLWTDSILSYGKCCPPPPITTGTGRTPPTRTPTQIPTTLITLPPTQPFSLTPSPSAPGNSTHGPVTATTQPDSTRTTIPSSQWSTITLTVPPPTTSGNNRESPHVTPSSSSSPGRSSLTDPPVTVIPTLPLGPLLPSDYEFCWEDWWISNTGYLLSSHKVSAEKSYASTLATTDIYRLIPLLNYRGLFEEGIHSIVATELEKLGADALNQLVAIASGTAKMPSGSRVLSISHMTYRCLAIRALGLVGDADSSKHLASIIENSGRSTANLAASRSQELVGLLGSKDWEIRFWACESLGRLGDPASMELLAKIMTGDSSKLVRASAAEAIARIASADSSKVLCDALPKSKAYYFSQAFVAASIGYCGISNPFDLIKDGLTSDLPDVRIASAYAAAAVVNRNFEAGRESPALIELYVEAMKREGDADVRRGMAMCLILLARSAGFKLIKPFLRDSRDMAVSAIAAIAAGVGGYVEAIDSISLDFIVTSEEVERARLYSLAMMMTPNRAKLARDMMNEESEVLQSTGALALTILGGEDADKAVLALKPERAEGLLRRTIVMSAPFLGGKGAKAVYRFARSSKDEERAIALIGLGMLNDAESLAELGRYSGARDKCVKSCSRIGTSLMGGLALTDSLDPALSNANEKVRAAGCVALASLNRSESLEKIFEMALKDNSYRARGFAIASLAAMTLTGKDRERTVKVLCEVLAKDKNSMPCSLASLALARFPESRLAYDAVLKEIGNSDSDVASMAAIAIGMFKNPSSARDLISFLTSKRGTPAATAACIALGMLGDKSFVPILMDEMKNSTTGEHLEGVAFAIARCADERTMDEVIAMLDIDDFFIQEAAVKCIGMMKTLDDDRAVIVRDKLSNFGKSGNDTYLRFYSAVVGYSLGDMTALGRLLDAASAKGFSPRLDEPDTTQLMEMVNENMPIFHKLLPYFAGVDE